MRYLIPVLIICSLLVSCSILDNSNSGKLEIKLVPQIASINDPVNLIIENETNLTYRYYCGHTVEIKQNDEWVKHTGVGCTNAFPVVIKTGQKFEINDILLSPSQPGYYRVIVGVASNDDSISDSRRISEPVKFIEALND